MSMVIKDLRYLAASDPEATRDYFAFLKSLTSILKRAQWGQERCGIVAGTGTWV